MFCVPDVMILAVILESIPWCHLVSRHSIPGFWTRDSLYSSMLIVFASSFRILVNFAIVLEIRGISFFQYHEPIWQKPLNQKITIRLLLMSSPFYIVNLPVLPFCMGCPEEMLSYARRTNLCQPGSRVGFARVNLYRTHTLLLNRVYPRPTTLPMGLDFDPRSYRAPIGSDGIYIFYFI